MIASLAAALLFAACSSDDNDGQLSEDLAIAESKVIFTAAGGDGYIAVESTSEFTARSTELWCHPSVEGHNVLVHVDRHLAKENRYAQVIIENRSGREHKVAVMQNGNTFTVFDEIVTLDNSDATTRVDIWHYVDVTATSDADWLRAVASDGQLLLTPTANESGKIRSCYVRFEGENIKDSILVQQGERSDVLGTYHLNYYKWETLSTRNNSYHTLEGKYVKVRMEEDGQGQVCMVFPENNQFMPSVSVPLTWEEGELRFYIHGGQRIGSVNPSARSTYYSLFSGVQINNSAAGAYQSYASLAFQFYNEGDNVVARTFDNNSMSEYVTTGLMFFLAPLDATSITEANILGRYGYMQDLHLTKVKD